MVKVGNKESNKQKSIDYWREVISRYEASGLSRKQFCFENGIEFGAFKNWIYRLRATDQSPQNEHVPENIPLFTPINLKEDADVPCEEAGESPLILEFPGMRIVVSAGFGETTLRRLLHVIGG